MVSRVCFVDEMGKKMNKKPIINLILDDTNVIINKLEKSSNLNEQGKVGIVLLRNQIELLEQQLKNMQKDLNYSNAFANCDTHYEQQEMEKQGIWNQYYESEND